ncbi:MAG: hypothetical protein OXI01_06650 [Albidovulum sp.]|nr:hypothetical protein [Albidovulum sp.]
MKLDGYIREIRRPAGRTRINHESGLRSLAVYGKTAHYILDFRHAAEYLAEALNPLHPDRMARKARFKTPEARLKVGEAASVVEELRPHRAADPAVAACIDYFETNLERMRYAEFRRLGLQIGSGVVEGGFKSVVGLRMKRPGSRRTARGGNRVLSIKCCILNGAWVDFLDWRRGKELAA